MSSPKTEKSGVPERGSVKLYKLNALTLMVTFFWSTFWEQFSVTIDEKDNLLNAQKLAYLRDAFKDGPAKDVIAGLTQSGVNYKEPIECLQE